MRAGQSHRLLRVGEALRHALSDILMRGDLRDPALEGASVTVTEVRPSADLRHATVYIMPLGGKDTDEVLDGLARSAGYLSSQAAQRVRMKFFPKFIFRLDPSFDTADRIEKLLRDPRVARDLEHEQTPPDEE
jgi:ribosome-binding factor A